MRSLYNNILHTLNEMESASSDMDDDYNPQEKAAERFIEPPISGEVSSLDSVNIYGQSDESENTGEISGRRDALYTALEADGITGKALFNLEDGLPQIQTHAKRIALRIEEFRDAKKVVRDLSGDDLVSAIVDSIVRVKLYFWYTIGIYQEKVHLTGKLDSQTTMGALWKPNRSQLSDLKAIFSALPNEFKTIVFNKTDFLTSYLSIKESKILSTLYGITEAEGFQSSATMDLDSNAENFAIDYLFDYAFQIFIKEYSNASIKDLPKIDETIFKHFSNPFHVNNVLRSAKDRAMGKTKMELDPETGKMKRVLNPKLSRGVVEPKLSDGDTEISNAIDQTIQDPAEAPISDATIDNLDIMTHSGETEKEAKDRPILFSSNNFLLKYFSNMSYLSIAGELLNRWSEVPGDKITFFDHSSLEMREIPLLTLLFNSSNSYVTDTAVPVSVLSVDVISESADFLVSLTGEPIPIDDSVLNGLNNMFLGDSSITARHNLPWFQIKTLPGRYKEYLRTYLKLSTLPEFAINDSATLVGNSVKEKLIDRLKRQLLIPGTDQAKLKQIIASMHVTENPIELERLAMLAGLSGATIKNIRVSAPDSSEHAQALALHKTSDMELSKKVAASLYDKFSILSKDTLDKLFYYNGNEINKKQLPTFVASMSKQELSSLWDDIKSGALQTSMGVPFLSLASTGPGKKAVDTLTANIEALLKTKGSLSEGILVEGAIETASDILQEEYVKFFVAQIAPILQKIVIDLKKLGSFLVSMIKLFEKYSAYQKDVNQKHKNTRMTNEELDEIEELLSFFSSASNNTLFTAHFLRNQLRRELLDSNTVAKIANAFEANKNNRELITPTADPVLGAALPKLKNWLLTYFDKHNEYGFLAAFEHLEKTGDISKLRDLLYKNRDALGSLLSGGSIAKLTKEIMRGTYGSEKQEKAPVETGADIQDPLALF